MLRRAALPLVKPQFLRPAVLRAPLSQYSFRSYSRSPGPDSDYKVPKANGSSSSPKAKEPLRKVPFSPLNPSQESQSSPAPDSSFGSDPDRDIENVLKTVDQASNRSANHQSASTAKSPEDEILQQQDTVQTDEPPQPQTPLPDLTRGIPSTLDAELKQARAKHSSSSQSSLNITEDPAEDTTSPAGSDRRGRDIPRTEYISSSDRKKNTAFKYMYVVLGGGLIVYSVYLGRNWDNEEEEQAHSEAPSGWGVSLFYNRIKARLGSTMSYYRDPVTTKLLPDEDADPNLRFPFVLVLSLEDMLVHSEWTRDKGWRIAKRPGMDYFLRYLSAYYEIALFTSQPMAMTEQILRKLDPYGVIRWPLFREATLYKDGGYIKVRNKTNL